MMTIRDNRTITSAVTFEDLPIGTLYEDKHKNLCIKTNEHHCIYHHDNGQWVEFEEADSAIVVPLRATITIEGESK